MLELDLKDLGPKGSSDGTQGVKVWWEIPKGRKKAVLTVAWGDLVLIKPLLVWPKGVHPGGQERWKQKRPMRITYVPVLHRVQYQDILEVPVVGELYEVSPKKAKRLKKDRGGCRLERCWMARLRLASGKSYLVGHRGLKRASLALETPMARLNLTLHVVGEVPVVLAHGGGLRAVLPALVEAVA